MAKEIYLLFSCDAWKTNDSLRLIVATTSIRKLKNILKQNITNKNMEYDTPRSISAACRELSAMDFKNDLYLINTLLEYGYIECVVDGEIQ